VLAIEAEAFPTPWTRDNFRFEIHSNPFARNLVVRLGNALLGYACLWVVGDELKINNIAVLREWRGRGVGTALLRRVFDRGRAEGCREAELEVRPTNDVARRLYERHGFREVRRRKGYYQDTREDAIVMTAPL
jgi:ribosomal-protein-alanine N-acetyltransferase